jgi:hypothetical protein
LGHFQIEIFREEEEEEEEKKGGKLNFKNQKN